MTVRPKSKHGVVVARLQDQVPGPIVQSVAEAQLVPDVSAREDRQR